MSRDAADMQASYFPLQQLVVPEARIAAPVDMYLRFDGNSSVDGSRRQIKLDHGATVSTDTFFNAFSVEAWRRSCRIEDLALGFRGHGHFALTIALRHAGEPTRTLLRTSLTLVSGHESYVELPFWPALNDGLLFYVLAALEDCATLHGSSYLTSTASRQPVHLGIVITHYNRLAAVTSAVSMMEEQLLQDSLFGDSVEIVIVDNSRTIDADALPGSTVLRSANLGGSGGFTRGLMYLEDAGRFTHCLFMDDDAACEIEAVRRTVSILMFARRDRIAVAGALLRTDRPACLIEKGASFDGRSRPLKGGLNMTCVEDILEAEREREQPQYGGWWFFAFALQDVHHYPFPFFVRGDDICFSLMNRFSVTTMIGVASWSEDFGIKNNPSTLYFDVRHHLLNGMVTLGHSRLTLALLAWKFFIRQLFSYRYESAEAILLSLTHVTRGPQFWLDDLDASAARTQIGSFWNIERMLPANDERHYAIASTHKAHEPIRDAVRWMTLNGHLLPPVLMRNGILRQEKSFSGQTKQLFRYPAVSYEDKTNNTAFITVISRKRALVQLCAFVMQILIFLAIFSRLRKGFADAFRRWTARSFWEEIMMRIAS